MALHHAGQRAATERRQCAGHVANQRGRTDYEADPSTGLKAFTQCKDDLEMSGMQRLVENKVVRRLNKPIDYLQVVFRVRVLMIVSVEDASDRLEREIRRRLS